MYRLPVKWFAFFFIVGLLMILGLRSKIKNGFLTRFCHHHNLHFKKLTDEALKCPPFAEWKETVPQPLLEKHQPIDIYNAYKTCFYYKRPHDHTDTFDGENMHGSMHYNSKDKHSLMQCTNMTGTDKLPSSHW